MNLAFVSDLHFDINENNSKADYFAALAEMTQENNVEMWFIGGDISNHIDVTFEFVEELQHFLEIPVYFIPGNHDYWEEDAVTPDTKKLYQRYVAHQQCLLEKPVLVGDDTVILGHTTWYNYAFADNRFSTADLQRKEYQERVWQDSIKTNWGMDDQELSQSIATQMRGEFEKYQDKDIIFLSHMVTIEEFSVTQPNTVFDYFNAFIGTDDFLDIFEEFEPRDVLMGHVHYRRELEKGPTTYHCICLGYPKEWRSNNLLKELNESTRILKV